MDTNMALLDGQHGEPNYIGEFAFGIGSAHHWTAGGDIAQWRYFYQDDVGYAQSVAYALWWAQSDFNANTQALLRNEF